MILLSSQMPNSWCIMIHTYYCILVLYMLISLKKHIVYIHIIPQQWKGGKLDNFILVLERQGPALYTQCSILWLWMTWYQGINRHGTDLIKSPRYTGGDFMFLYRFVCRCHRRLQIIFHAITFEQIFGFLSFFARLLALTYRLPD